MDIRKYKDTVKKIIGTRFYNSLLQTYFFKNNPDFKELSHTNVDLKGKYAGKRCFIIGNGPSLNSVDFSLLESEYTFTVNQLPRNNNFEKLKTNFHIWADQRFFNLDLNRSEDLELFNIMKAVRTADNNPIVFYKWSARAMIKQTHLDKVLNIHYFGDVGLDISQKLRSKQAMDICRPLPIFSTVVHYAICLAVYMGFKEIYLLGCDCTGFISTAQAKLKNSKQAEYAYVISDNEKKRMERISCETTIRDELMWYAELFDTYDKLNVYCKNCGVTIYNATESSLLESIPRVTIESLF